MGASGSRESEATPRRSNRWLHSIIVRKTLLPSGVNLLNLSGLPAAARSDSDILRKVVASPLVQASGEGGSVYGRAAGAMIPASLRDLGEAGRPGSWG